MAQQIRYGIGFDVKKDSLQQIKKSLIELQKLTSKDLLNLNKGLKASEAEGALKKIKDDAKLVEKALDSAFNPKLNMVNIESFNQRLKDSDRSLNKIYSSFSQAGATGENAFRNLSARMLDVNVQAKETHAILDKMATTLGNTIKWNIASSAVNTLTRSVQQAWGYVKSLDTSLNDIRIVTGKSSEEMGNFAKQANEAAESLGRTTTDYTKAALIYAQQGLDDEEIAKRSQITLKAANVTGQSTDAVSEELTAVWNGYKVNAEQAEIYVDRLAAVAATTASNLEELSTGMSKVASAANELGVGEDQLAAQLSTIISATRQAPETVGTALKTVYARISDIKAGVDQDGVTLGKYSGDMANLGINVLNAQGKLRDMGSIIEEVGSKWQGMTREQQISLAQTMAGQRQYSNLMALFGNFDKYTSALNTAQNAAGTLQQQQDIYMESTAAHLEQLTASIEKIYNGLLDTDSINDLIDGLVTATKVVSNFVESIGGGGNLLKSLGAIGLTVFSKQIAGGIQTTINNLQLAKAQAQLFQNTLAEAKNQQNLGSGMEQYTQYLTNNWANLLNGVNKLPTEMFDSIKSKIYQMKDAANGIDLIEEKMNLLEKSFNSLGPAMQSVLAGYESLDDALSSANGIQQVKQAFNKILTVFTPINQKIDQIKKSFKQMRFNVEIDPSKVEKNFNNLKSQMLSLIESFKNISIDNGNSSFFSTLPESTRIAVLKAKNELKKLDFSEIGNPKQASQQISGIYTNLISTIQGEIGKIESLMKSAEGGQLEKLKAEHESLQALLKKTEKDLDGIKPKAEQTINIQNWVDLAGGITQVTSAVRQLSNLGDIWNDENLSPSQKVLQTIMNLAMSLPMLYNGYTKLSKALNGITGSLKEQYIENLKSAAASTADAGAKGVQTAATQGATVATNGLIVKLKALWTTMLQNPLVPLIALLAAGVAWTVAMADAAQKARKQRIEEAKTSIDEQNQKQEQIEKNKELYKSLEDLNQQYKEGQITRTDLQGSISDLISEYGEQGKRIEALIGQYHDLNKAIKESRRESAEEGVASAEQEKEDASYVLTQAARDADLSLANSPYNTKLDNQILDSFKQFGATASTGPNGNNLFSINIEDGQQALDLYDKLVQKKKEIDQNSSISDVERSRSDNYKWLTDQINELRENAQAYRQAVQDLSKYATDLEAINSDNGDFSEDKVKNAQDFQTQREALVNQYKELLQEKGDTESDPQAMVDAYIQQNYGDTFAKYNQVTKFIQQMEKETGQRNEQLIKILQDLSPQQFGQVMEKFALNPQAFSNWESMSVIIKDLFGDIENADLSNVDKIQQMNFDDIEQEAKSRYNDYKDIEKKARDSGGELEEEDFSKLKTLSPELAGYFEDLGNGTYKLRDDARAFYSEINSLKLDGFDSAIETVQNKIDHLNAVKDSEITSDEIDDLRDKSSTDITIHRGANGQNDVLKVNEDIAKKKLQILLLTTDINDENYKLLEEYQKQAEANNLNYDIAKDIDKQYNLIAGNTELNNEKIKEQLGLLDQEKEKLEGQKEGLSTDFVPDSEVDPKELESLTQTMEELAEKDDKLANSLKKNHKTAKEAAHALLRYNNALEEVDKNYDNWMQALQSDNIVEQNKAMEQLKDTYGDFLDIDGEQLSEDFLSDTHNLQLMRQAMEGNKEAYAELAYQAALDKLSPEIDLSKFGEQTNELKEAYFGIQDQLDALPIGATLDNQQFLDALNQMIAAMGLTQQQAGQMIEGLGMSAEFDDNPSESKDTETKQNLQAEFTEAVGDGTTRIMAPGGIGNMITETARAVGIAYNLVDPTTAESEKTTTAPTVKVKSLKKTSGGDFKRKSTPHKGPSGSGGGKGKKGKGGGGKGKKGSSSKKNEPDKTQKDLQKKLKDERDIYHDINIQIGKINKNLDRAQKKQDRLYGKQLIKNLNEQTKILEKHKKKLEEKNKLQQKDLKNQRKALKNLGVTFNKYGDISNYMSVLGKKQKEVNALVDKQNKLIKQYNAETDKEKKQKINEQIEKIGKQKSTKEEDYKDLKDRIKNYDELREQIEDVKDQIEEETQKQIEIKIEKFRMKIEIRLEMGEAERDWNKFKRDVLEHTDILKDSDFSKNLKDTQLNYADARSYFRTQYKNAAGKTVTAPGTIQALTSQLLNTQKEFKLAENGKSSIYGDNQKQAMQDMQSDLDELMSQMEDYESLIDEIDEAYLDTIDNISDFFDKQIEDYEYVAELIQHDMNLLTLLYGEKNYNAMNGYYTQLQNNNLKQIDSLRKQKDFWEREWKEAAARGDTNAAQKFKENYKKVLGDLNSAVEDAAKTIQDKYTNAINSIFDQLDKKMTNGQGSDYLNMEWDLMKKNGEQYLDTINSAFAIQQTQRKYQKAVDDTKSIKSQKELKKLMNDQLNILKNKQKLTQYDIDRAQKLLQVEQARIALQDARSAKTSMQLKRDSQGNYSYEYVADNDMVEEAESGYANALNDLYNFDLDRYKGNLEEMLSAWEEFQEKYKEIQLDISLTDEERVQRLKLLEDQYGEYINGKTQENLVIRNNLKESAFKDMEYLYDEDVAKFQNMSDNEQAILMEQLVPQWNAGIEQMALKFSGEGGFIPSCEQAFKEVRLATKDYQDELDTLADIAETDFDSLRDGVSEAANEYSPLIENNDTLISQMGTELTSIEDLIEAAHDLSLEYKAVYDQAIAAVKAITQLMQTQKAQAAAEAQRKKDEEDAKKKKQQEKNTSKKAQWQTDNYSGLLKKQRAQYVTDLKHQGKTQKDKSLNVDQSIKSGQLQQIDGAKKNIIMGIAGSILLSKSWGDGETRRKNMIEVFGEQLGKEMYNRVHEYLRDSIVNNEQYKKDIIKNASWYQSFDKDKLKGSASFYLKNLQSWVSQGNKKAVYDTGGYTGNWNSSQGRPAILHEKELVLNKQDTKNILDSVTIMRSIMASMSGNIISKLGSLTSINSTTSSFGNNSMLQQQVKIQATFPNVNSKKEIEQALNDLVNLAAQRAMR